MAAFWSPVLGGEAGAGAERDARPEEQEGFVLLLQTHREADGYGGIYAVYL